MTVRSISAAAIAAALLLAGPAAPAGAKKKPRCEARKGTTLITVNGKRVFATDSKRVNSSYTTRVFACKPGSRQKPRLLQKVGGNDESYSRPTDAHLSSDGRWLLVNYYEEGGVSTANHARLYDLKTGAMRFELGFANAGERAVDFVVTDAGAVAALYEDLESPVRVYDAAGERTVSPPKAKSLAVGGNVVYWTVDGAAGSATLGGPPSGDVTVE